MINLPEKYFMTSCRFVEKKNLFFLIEAFSRFRQNNNCFKLLLVGDGPLKNKLEKFTKELSLENDIIFTGYKEYDHIKNIYSKASCFILPSITEQWGLVVNESLASGIPVIASNRVGSAPNLVENNNVGYTFDPFSLDDLVTKMEMIVDDLKSIDFTINTRRVISKWGGEKYSKNIYQAANIAIDHHHMRSFAATWFLSLFIKILK
jgi:glycosyltransferase involved in cell wall biosynthesis